MANYDIKPSSKFCATPSNFSKVQNAKAFSASSKMGIYIKVSNQLLNVEIHTSPNLTLAFLWKQLNNNQVH